MRVVSNTSPRSNLAIIGRLELLQRRYAEILIALEVASELAARALGLTFRSQPAQHALGQAGLLAPSGARRAGHPGGKRLLTPALSSAEEERENFHSSSCQTFRSMGEPSWLSQARSEGVRASGR